MHLKFEDYRTGENGNSHPVRMQGAASGLGHTGEKARVMGLVLVTTSHQVIIEPQVHEKLHHMGFADQIIVFACQRTNNDMEKAVELLEDIHKEIKNDLKTVRETPTRDRKKWLCTEKNNLLYINYVKKLKDINLVQKKD